MVVPGKVTPYILVVTTHMFLYYTCIYSIAYLTGRETPLPV